MDFSKTALLLLIVIIRSSWFEDGKGFALAKSRLRMRKPPSVKRPTRQTFKPTRQQWSPSQKTAPPSNYHPKNSWSETKSAKQNQRPAPKPTKSAKWNKPKPERLDRLYSTKSDLQEEWFKPMTVVQDGKQEKYSTKPFATCPFASCPQSVPLPQSVPNYYSHSPYGGPNDGSHRDGSDYMLILLASESYPQPITAEENGYHQPLRNGSSSSTDVVGNFVFFFVWILLNAIWH